MLQLTLLISSVLHNLFLNHLDYQPHVTNPKMKAAAIILMCIGFFVLIKNSQATDPDKVFNTLATGEDSDIGRFIPPKGLVVYLVKNDWRSSEGITATVAETLVFQMDADRNYFMSKGKWDAMIQTAAWLREKNPADVWSELSGKALQISTENLKYMDENNWEVYSPGLTSQEAAYHMACGWSYITKAEWSVTLEIEAFIRNQ